MELLMKKEELFIAIIGAMTILTACGNTAYESAAAASSSAEEEIISESAKISSSETDESTAESSDSGKSKKEKSSTSKSAKKSKSDTSSSDSEETDGNAAYVLSDGENVDGGTYTATEENMSVFEASEDVNATITGSVINKADGSASSADDSSFKGVNAAVRAYGNSTITLKECTITADAENATGVFAYDNGTIYISDSTVNVTGGGAGGIQVAGGGTLYASNLNVTSSSKAAIRSDRGGGVLVVDGGNYTSEGSNGCPAIYSTADITVKNAECTAQNSRAVIIEGKNSVSLENCVLSGNDQSSKEGSVKGNVLLYQSASGDADDGTSELTMNGGSITSNSGAMFYCTNTSSEINLTDAKLVLSEDNTLLIVSEGRWGNEGSNGGICTLNADNQELSGRITVDDISSLSLNLTDSTYKGAINETGYAGEVNVILDDNSKWILTADSYITSFTGNEANIEFNGYKLYIND
ncbi:MAG: hypothetical protein E7301_00245 [Butyrivibrio sp.]|nr:hypothetical protein [Butyrivibrio sp.]